MALHPGYFVLLTDWTLPPLHSTLLYTAVVIGQMSGANNVNKAGNSLGDLWLITHITPIIPAHRCQPNVSDSTTREQLQISFTLSLTETTRVCEKGVSTFRVRCSVDSGHL